MQVIDRTKQAELIASPVSDGAGGYRVTISALIDNSQVIHIGNETSQSSQLDSGDSIDVAGPSLSLVYVKGTPPGWGITDVVQGPKQFKFLGDQTARILPGDQVSVVGSTGNDGFYTVVSVVFGTGKTTVEVAETIPDATSDGDLFHADKVAIFGRG